MTDLTLTIAAGFADGVGNTMTASQWTAPLDEIETFLHGLVGRDGSPVDNWKSDGSVTAPVFRINAASEVFRVAGATDEWSVSADTAVSGGPPHALNPSPLPGGSIRFFLRADAVALWVVYQGKLVAAASGSNGYELLSYLDGALVSNAGLVQMTTTSLTGSTVVNWVEDTAASIEKGWHSIKLVLSRISSSTQFVYRDTELIVIAAYK